MSASAPATITDAVLGARLDPAAPLITFYDDDSGERTELSGLTTLNWAAKTANFLRDEAGVAPGDSVAVDLPEHWQTLVVLLGAWWAGAQVLIGPAADATVVFCALDRLDAHADVDEVVVAPLDAFALGVPGLPAGVADFGSAVRVHGDQFAPVVAGPLAVDGRTTADVLAAAAGFAADAGISSSDRVLSSRRWSTADDVIANLLATLVSGAALVQVAHPDDTRMDSRADAERTTVTLA